MRKRRAAAQASNVTDEKGAEVICAGFGLDLKGIELSVVPIAESCCHVSSVQLRLAPAIQWHSLIPRAAAPS